MNSAGSFTTSNRTGRKPTILRRRGRTSCVTSRKSSPRRGRATTCFRWTTPSCTLGPKPNYALGRTVFAYSSELANVPHPGAGGAPNVLNKSYTITSEVEIPDGGAEGMLVTDGGHFGVYGLYLLKGGPVFCWNQLQLGIVWEFRRSTLRTLQSVAKGR